MKRVAYGLRQRIDDYGKSHQHPINQRLHFVGIPVLAVAILGLFAKAVIPVDGLPNSLHPNLGWVAWTVAAGWCLCHDWRIGIANGAFLCLCLAIGVALPLTILVGFLAIGIGVHFVGHFGFEHKPPSILTDPLSLVEASPWLLSNIFRKP
jgi:uncharacterized membrane protein YGL010W